MAGAGAGGNIAATLAHEVRGLSYQVRSDNIIRSDKINDKIILYSSPAGNYSVAQSLSRNIKLTQGCR